MISYKKLFDLLEAHGYTSYKIRQENLIGQGTLTRLKKGSCGIDFNTINTICRKFNVQPGDLMEYIPDEQAQRKPEA